MLRNALLSTYFHATFPLRQLMAAQLAERGQSPVSVLFYHRVADDEPNDWTMSTAMFTQQIQWLKQNFDLVSLADAQERVRQGINRRPTVAITFDDGYGDNCSHAIPLLIKERIPCTYFVASKYVLENQPFPHDLARGVPLRPNSVSELQAMAKAGIEIGSHTRTHIDLGRVHDLKELRREVVDAAHELEDAVGTPIRYFAFPFGLHANLNVEAFKLARRAGYRGVCSAYGGYNWPGDDSFHMQRIHADPEMLRFKNWLTFDLRKHRKVERFVYEPADANQQRRAVTTTASFSKG
jgi:peptidoglycan/xylan/chitin deacetylase (PgdA/CDA1 family)